MFTYTCVYNVCKTWLHTVYTYRCAYNVYMHVCMQRIHTRVHTTYTCTCTDNVYMHVCKQHMCTQHRHTHAHTAYTHTRVCIQCRTLFLDVMREPCSGRLLSIECFRACCTSLLMSSAKERTRVHTRVAYTCADYVCAHVRKHTRTGTNGYVCLCVRIIGSSTCLQDAECVYLMFTCTFCSYVLERKQYIGQYKTLI